MPKTTILITDINKDSFPTLPQEIQCHLSPYEQQIKYFSPLPFCQRIVIVLDTDDVANECFNTLKDDYPDLRIHHMETLVRDTPKGLTIEERQCPTILFPTSPKPHVYLEPMPQKTESMASGTTTLLHQPLVIDTSVGNTAGPVSPTILLETE